MRKCGKCGQTDHYRSTCKQNSAKKPAKKAKKGRKCGKCGQTGHNSRTCSNQEKEIVKPEPVEVEKPKKKKVLICSLCKEDEHTAKNCPYKPVPEGTKLGPTRMECGHFSWWLTKNKECKVCESSIKRKRERRKERKTE